MTDRCPTCGAPAIRGPARQRTTVDAVSYWTHDPDAVIRERVQGLTDTALGPVMEAMSGGEYNSVYDYEGRIRSALLRALGAA